MMATQKLAYVTGFPELDAKLRSLAPAIQRKFVRGALRRGAKRAVKRYQTIVASEAHDTGTAEKSVKVKALKRSRVRAGIQVFVDAEKLFERYAATHHGNPPHPSKGETRPHYYIADIELGNHQEKPVRPLRRSIYEQPEVYRNYFRDDVLQFIAENKVTTKLPKESK